VEVEHEVEHLEVKERIRGCSFGQPGNMQVGGRLGSPRSIRWRKGELIGAGTLQGLSVPDQFYSMWALPFKYMTTSNDTEEILLCNWLYNLRCLRLWQFHLVKLSDNNMPGRCMRWPPQNLLKVFCFICVFKAEPQYANSLRNS